MNSKSRSHLILALTLVLICPRPEAAPGQIDGELLIKWRDGPESSAAVAGNALVGCTVKRNFSAIGWQQVALPPGMTVGEGLAAYRALDTVLVVEPNRTATLQLPPIEQEPVDGGGLITMDYRIPDDPLFNQQWGLKKIGLTNAWAVTTGSTNVVVAVLDSGITYTHEDLAANMWRNPGETGLDAHGNDKATNGIDDDGNGFVDDVYGVDVASDERGNDGDPFDEGEDVSGGGRLFHGTATASLIGAVGNNGKGIAGVNWSVQLMAIRSTTTNNLISVADTIAGFEYVVMMKRRGVNIRVTNNSYFLDPLGCGSQALKDAIDAADSEGILNVFAAGNWAVNIDAAALYPQRYDSPSVVCVAASDQSDNLASFSDYGRTGADLAAPGQAMNVILGPTTNTYASGYAGTSFACPLVAGTAALLLAANPDLTVDELKAALFGSVDQPASLRNKLVTHGRLNAARALEYLSNANPPAIVIYAAPGGPHTARNAPIQVTFNRPMNRASVESALVIKPPVPGVFEWTPDSRSFTFRHDAPFDSTTNYTLTILGTAQDAAGGTLDGNFNRAGEGSPTDDFLWTFRFPIPNDDFANAQPLTGQSGSITNSNRYSWSEADEPNHVLGEYGLVANSVWYRWTAPEPGGWVTFDLTSGTAFDSLLAVYTGDRLDRLTSIAGNDNYGTKSGSRVSFAAMAGTNYSIAVAGKDLLDVLNPAKAGNFTLTWYPTPPPGFTGVQFTPQSAVPGTKVTLFGTNFTGATSVLFNGASATFTNALTNNLDLRITAVVPPDASSGAITVNTSRGDVTSSATFQVLPPKLSIVFNAATGLEITWPATSSTIALQTTDDLASGTWVPVTESPVVEAGQSRLHIAAPTGNRFYRLKGN
jgi:thermitase